MPYTVPYSQVWDYSISQATLETIFMSFAKDQEEETASVPGVSYTDTTNRNIANRNLPSCNNGGHERQRRSVVPSMDVEMGPLGSSRKNCQQGSANGGLADQEEKAGLL